MLHLRARVAPRPIDSASAERSMPGVSTTCVVGTLGDTTGATAGAGRGTPAALQIASHRPANWTFLWIVGSHTKPKAAATKTMAVVIATLPVNQGLRGEKRRSLRISRPQ